MFASLHTSRYALRHLTTQGGRRRPLVRLLTALTLHRQRQQLARMDDALLNDIGLTREQAQQEAARGFGLWDAPAHWRA